VGREIALPSQSLVDRVNAQNGHIKYGGFNFEISEEKTK
jgi:hypothetical protein